MDVNSPLESGFLAFSVVNCLHYQLIALELVLMETICRWRTRGSRDPETALLSRGLVLAAIVAACVVLANPFVLERYFSAHEELFHALFTGGELPVADHFAGPLEEGAVSARDGRRRPPNIVLILSDAHRWDYTGNPGHPFVETPNLDRLAAGGGLFQQRLRDDIRLQPL